MPKRVTVSDDTIQKMEPLAKPFESVDDCLQRILECSCIKKEMKKGKQEKDDEVVEEES